MSSILIEVPVEPETCRHESVEELGHDGGAVFYWCLVCRSIMLVQKGHRWIIRPTDGEGPLPF